MLKTLLQRAIAEDYQNNPGKEIYLQFSAGCDSTALLFAMAELRGPKDHHFTCISYFYKQKKVYLNKLNAICKRYTIPLRIVPLTTDEVMANVEELKALGYTGKVLLDCLAGHLPITKQLRDSLIVNGSYADILYGSYFFQFRPPLTQEKFNEIRTKLLNKPGQDGVGPLAELLFNNHNVLSTPFSNKGVVDYFMSKSFEECGGTRKTLFKQEFTGELKTIPYKVTCMAQQIESGIRDLRKRDKICAV